jgi:cyclopropane fatty-acyl-phospholipid synthase-like methyltransferase
MKFDIKHVPLPYQINYAGLVKHGGDETLYREEVGANFENWEQYYGKRQSAILEGQPNLFHGNDRHPEFANIVEALSLEPGQRVLDYGCATIAVGEHLIRYLDPQCYVGMDVSKEAIELGRKRIRETDLYLKGPVVLHLPQGEFPSESLLHFDYAIALSVFTHCPPKTILAIIKYVRSLLKPGGKFMADVCLVEKDIIFQGYHNFYYPKEFFEFACERFGVRYELFPDLKVKVNDRRALGEYYKLVIIA